MKPDQLEALLAFTPKAAGVFLLGYALSQARRVTNDVTNHIGQFGDDNAGKRRVVFRAIFNFYIAFSTIIVVVCGLFELFQRELFVAALIALLTGLGIKMSYDIRA